MSFRRYGAMFDESNVFSVLGTRFEVSNFLKIIRLTRNLPWNFYTFFNPRSIGLIFAKLNLDAPFLRQYQMRKLHQWGGNLHVQDQLPEFDGGDYRSSFWRLH
jgi:hypothetical protein